MHKVKGKRTFIEELTKWYTTYQKVRITDYQMKKNVITHTEEACPVAKALKLLGGKWTLLILFRIGKQVMRYGEIKRSIPHISEKMLVQELNFLVENKLVTKKMYPEIPPKVEYRLTALGLKSLAIIDELESFGMENLT